MTDNSEELAEAAGKPRFGLDDALLDRLSGEWRLTRRFPTRVVMNHVRAEWVLNHQFLRVHMIDVEVPPQYEALVTIGFNEESQRYVIYWLDTFGGRYSSHGEGERSGDTIRFAFPYPDGALTNTFTWDPSTTAWRALVEQQDEQGVWTTFCEDTLERA